MHVNDKYNAELCHLAKEITKSSQNTHTRGSRAKNLFNALLGRKSNPLSLFKKEKKLLFKVKTITDETAEEVKNSFDAIIGTIDPDNKKAREKMLKEMQNISAIVQHTIDENGAESQAQILFATLLERLKLGEDPDSLFKEYDRLDDKFSSPDLAEIKHELAELFSEKGFQVIEEEGQPYYASLGLRGAIFHTSENPIPSAPPLDEELPVLSNRELSLFQDKLGEIDGKVDSVLKRLDSLLKKEKVGKMQIHLFMKKLNEMNSALDRFYDRGHLEKLANHSGLDEQLVQLKEKLSIIDQKFQSDIYSLLCNPSFRDLDGIRNMEQKKFNPQGHLFLDYYLIYQRFDLLKGAVKQACEKNSVVVLQESEFGKEMREKNSEILIPHLLGYEMPLPGHFHEGNTLRLRNLFKVWGKYQSLASTQMEQCQLRFIDSLFLNDVLNSKGLRENIGRSYEDYTQFLIDALDQKRQGIFQFDPSKDIPFKIQSKMRNWLKDNNPEPLGFNLRG